MLLLPLSWSLLPVVLLPVLLLLLPLFLHHLPCHSSRKQVSKLPPGDFGWCPFLGRTLSFISPHHSFSTGKFLDDNIKCYGRIFRCHLFGHPTVVSCDAGFNSFVLQNEERLFLSSYPRNIPDVIGPRNFLVATGEPHRHIRSLALSLLASVRHQSSHFLPDIEDSVVRVMATWRNMETLSVCDEARKFTFTVIVKQILSLGPDDKETNQMLGNFKTFMKGLVSAPIKLPGMPYTRAIEAKHGLEDIVSSLLRRRRASGGGEALVDGARVDFLDVLISRGDMSDEEMVDLVIGLLLGGYETTAMLISIIVRLLADHPRVLESLRVEHRAVAAGGRRLDWEAYTGMTFTHCVINEALRFGNVVKFVHRKTIKPVQYKGYEIPAGWKVLPIFSGVHLDPSLHENPLQFDPWRWQQNEEAAGGGQSFSPFGGGKRLCPGSELAKVEVAFFVHHLVLSFSWTPLEEEDQPMSYPYLDFKRGLQIAIQPLDRSDFIVN